VRRGARVTSARSGDRISPVLHRLFIDASSHGAKLRPCGGHRSTAEPELTMRYVQYRVPARRPLIPASLRSALVVATTCAATITFALYLTAHAYCAKPGDWVLPACFG
jgi:hypothetical protein